jgi:hypothetical protein
VTLSYLPWAPTIDNETLPEARIERITAEGAAEIEVLVRSSIEETRLFFVVDGSIDKIAEESLSALACAYGL